ncbi:MAG TPA: CbiX/SirB N-terminal domain-containing protein [Giesbergeria sp.]|nr:CbiX/SirB N-terminal domain-containing protein [Giesbergeria sp.]HNI75401.1 CbiX/SirB N-terminal domain-containing protein [Giesbergeria sp.]HNK05649.1 CbiX/SirB N-terminal domain-containing protein [Giesbergeria sp.]HNM38839.1 CbiX/SirB N-terminal domain-containing protein [Giesbergeria sp.]
MTTPTQGIVLFAHGSRDPLWRAPIEAVEAHIRAHHPGVAVRCAYLELTTPDLPQAVDDLVDQGATAVTIVPMFLGTGKHAREDLPVLVAELRARHPRVQVHVQAAIGEDPRMTALMAHIACTPPAQ